MSVMVNFALPCLKSVIAQRNVGGICVLAFRLPGVGPQYWAPATRRSTSTACSYEMSEMSEPPEFAFIAAYLTSLAPFETFEAVKIILCKIWAVR